MGSAKAADVVRHALSMGADEGVVLQDEAFENLDSFGTAYVLGKAIQKIGAYDLVLCGRQAADWGAGQVGSILAEILSIPVITLASNIEVLDKTLKVKRMVKDGYEVLEAPMPSLITVSSEIGLPPHTGLPSDDDLHTEEQWLDIGGQIIHGGRYLSHDGTRPNQLAAPRIREVAGMAG